MGTSPIAPGMANRATSHGRPDGGANGGTKGEAANSELVKGGQKIDLQGIAKMMNKAAKKAEVARAALELRTTFLESNMAETLNMMQHLMANSPAASAYRAGAGAAGGAAAQQDVEVTLEGMNIVGDNTAGNEQMAEGGQGNEPKNGEKDGTEEEYNKRKGGADEAGEDDRSGAKKRKGEQDDDNDASPEKGDTA